MTGRERIKAAFKGLKPDVVPCYPIVSALAGKLIGVKASEYYTNLLRLADAQIALYGELKQDVVVLMADLFLEVEAMGARVEFPDDDMARLRSYLLGEDKGKLASLKRPDPATSGRMPAYIEACERVARAIKDSAIGGVLCGPWTLAVNLRGAENLIIDTATDPQFVHELMRFTVEISKAMGLAVNAAGVGLSFSEAPASCSLISPKIFKEFVLPYDRELAAYLKEHRIGLTLHVCGFIDPIMEMILDTGAVAVSMDQPSSLEKMLAAASGRAVTVGNVSTGVFVRGSEQDLEDEIKRCLAVGKGNYGYILASGCEISPRGDLEKVKHFCRRARELGKLD
ncbi:MAG TPA: uroporphyrinogen decarboxylase family protein [bacterium]|nr:uroporphyrinogen decarboxylase family protein [bacterium]